MKSVRNNVWELLKIRYGIVFEAMTFLAKRKVYWAVPLFLLILFISLFLIFGQATGLAPFIYPFF